MSGICSKFSLYPEMTTTSIKLDLAGLGDALSRLGGCSVGPGWNSQTYGEGVILVLGRVLPGLKWVLSSGLRYVKHQSGL